ncbi:MAG: hypothetical protein ACI37Z_09410 [Candidatus Gastranaerophilaceae bacterium]
MSNKIKLGNYKGKDLYWIPVYNNDPRYYILKDPICKMPFDMGLARYENSLIRKFIIEDFISNAFTQEDLQKIMPIADNFGDYASLLSYAEIRMHGKINPELLKYKGGWWLYCAKDGPHELASAGVVGFFGLVGDVNKSCKYGVRPYIILNL